MDDLISGCPDVRLYGWADWLLPAGLRYWARGQEMGETQYFPGVLRGFSGEKAQLLWADLSIWFL